MAPSELPASPSGLPASPPLTTTDRSRLRRKRDRGSADRAVADAILDEAVVCHVGFTTDSGPLVLPMAHVRVGEVLYVHGAPGNAMLRHLASGAPACVTVTLLDGLVLARSAFHHSVNYRSVVLFGAMEKVVGREEKRTATASLLDHFVAGRAAEARPPTDAELDATTFLRMPIGEGSVKVRTGGPVDDAEDLDWPCWAGHVPLAVTAGAPVAAAVGRAAPVPAALADPTPSPRAGWS
jgi:nitroimidazol reductase NimA-like FMN-containing flavoprotein (pyridoxamine 5'-phosphate oxidase superfamily)